MKPENTKASDGKYYTIVKLYNGAEYTGILFSQLISLLKACETYDDTNVDINENEKPLEIPEFLAKDLFKAQLRLERLLTGKELPCLEISETNNKNQACKILRTAGSRRSPLKCPWDGERKCVNEGSFYRLYDIYKEIYTSEGPRRIEIYRCLKDKKLFLLEKVNPEVEAHNFNKRCLRCQTDRIMVMAEDRNEIVYHCQTCHWWFAVGNFTAIDWEIDWYSKVKIMRRYANFRRIRHLHNLPVSPSVGEPIEKLAKSDLFYEIKKMIPLIQKYIGVLDRYREKASDGNYYRVVENENGINVIECGRELASPLIRFDLGVIDCPYCNFRPCLEHKLKRKEGFIHTVKKVNSNLLSVLQCDEKGYYYLCEYPD